MARKRSKRAGMQRRPTLLRPSSSTRMPVPGLHRRHIHAQSKPQRNNPYRSTDKSFMRGSLKDHKLAPIRASLKALKGNLKDTELHYLPQRARLAKSFKKNRLREPNSIRTRRNRRAFQAQMKRPTLRRRRTITHAKKSKLLSRQRTA